MDKVGENAEGWDEGEDLESAPEGEGDAGEDHLISCQSLVKVLIRGRGEEGFD